jgi:hypothetical protein
MGSSRTAAATAARLAAHQARLDALQAEADQVRVVGAGVDTLELNSQRPIRAELVDELEHLRHLAQQTPRDEPGPRWVWAGHSFEVSRGGGQRGSLLLQSPAMALSLAPYAPSGLPRATVELRAVHLWQDREAAASGAVALLDFASSHNEGADVQVSRLDVTVDWQGWIPAPGLLDAFRTRARRDAAYRQHRAHSGWSWGGGGSILCRCYDKTLEIRGTDKADWFPAVWAQSGAYDDAAPVWRLEYQVRREALRELGQPGWEGIFKTWGTARDELHSLFLELSLSWLSLRAGRTGDVRKVLDPRWQALRSMGAFGLARESSPAPSSLERIKAETEFSRTLEQLAAYVARGIAERWALRGHGQDLRSTHEALYDEVCQVFATKGTSLSDRVGELLDELEAQARAARLDSSPYQLSLH